MTDKPPTEYWGVDAAIEPLPGGNRNLAFRTLGSDNDLVFKTTRREPAAIEWLLPVLDLAQQSGFIVPKPIKSRNGYYVEQGWTCELYLRGQTFTGQDVNQVAARLLFFQKATQEMLQRPGFLSASDLIGRDFGGDVDLRLMPVDIVAICREAWSQTMKLPKSVVHGDLNAANLIWTIDGGIGLVDWDETRVDASLFDGFHAGLGHPGAASEAAVLAWEVACSWKLEPDYANRMAEKLRHLASKP